MRRRRTRDPSYLLRDHHFQVRRRGIWINAGFGGSSIGPRQIHDQMAIPSNSPGNSGIIVGWVIEGDSYIDYTLFFFLQERKRVSCYKNQWVRWREAATIKLDVKQTTVTSRRTRRKNLQRPSPLTYNSASTRLFNGGDATTAFHPHADKTSQNKPANDCRSTLVRSRFTIVIRHTNRLETTRI